MIWIRALAREWTNVLAMIPPGRRRWGIVALIGWWLSPLTAWNDSFTNIPLAIGSAYLLRALGAGVDPEAASVAAYVLTNVLGIVLLWLGVGKLSLGRQRRARKVNPGWFLRAGIRTLVYAALVYATVWSIQRMLAG